jgi:phosphate-selective porin OprO/OprP
MAGAFSKILVLIATALTSVVSPCAFSANDQDSPSTTSSARQKGMNENLEDAIPQSDKEMEQEQKLENPRIVVPENLGEMPQVDVQTSEDAADQELREDRGESVVAETQGRIDELEQELDIESSRLSDQPVLEKTDKFLEWSRLPLTYVQDHVPFLTKRHIIFFGRLEVDYAQYSSGILEDDSGFNIRRFRLGLAGHVRFWPGLNYKIEVDLTDGENTLSDAYLSWQSHKWGTFRIGNQKVAQTLSGQTSSLSIPFMERPLPVDAFTLQRRLGLGWDMHWKKVGANVTIFGADPNESLGSHGWAARAYFNPTRSGLHVIHVGGSFMQLSSDNDAQFQSRPESHVTSTALVDTGVWPGVGTGSALGLELAGARGPVTLRSEFYRSDWTRADSDNPQFKGWYAEVSWFLTGEMAHYREGKFIRPNINSPRGAWELAARFSTIDLNDLDVMGGTEKNLSFGVNWYSITHWRFMANLIKVRSDGPYGEQNPWIVQVRAQYYF